MLKQLSAHLREHREITAFVLGLIISIAGYILYESLQPHDHTYYDDEVHVHSDFLLVVNDEVISLAADKYQSSAQQILHTNFHFHDNDDEVMHRHAEGLTLAAFLTSLGFTLTTDCLVTDTKETYCTDETNALTLYVNGEPFEAITSYVPEERDRVLLYYGDQDNPQLETYLNDVTDRACIYSGTCPERGLPPPESCGLTCEI